MERTLNLKKVTVKDTFWSAKQKLIAGTVIPYQEKILNDEIPGIEKSHAVANFKIAAGLEQGEYYGMVFQDSDVAKWLEGVAYSLEQYPDKELEDRADALIDIIEKAQQPDGYLNTFFTIKEPEHRWENLQECHELYCAGHMMEAAAAYYETTGKDKLLKVMEKMADHIAGIFGTGRRTGIPGHQEIEIGLMKLYHVTGKEKYKDLAQYFLEERGKNPKFFLEESEKRGWKHFGMDPEDTKYNQSFAPVKEQKTAEGHAVRAIYMYTAMADVAAAAEDQEMKAACETLWDNIVRKRMYITGGVGSTVEGEAFTIDYDLPNDTAYAETCASCGMVFFARNMLKMDIDGKYADIMERELYNGILSGMQIDGKRFFYVNPLEVQPEISGKLYGYRHVLPERPEWYACACCPPNVVRTVMALGKYAWGQDENVIYSHLFLGGTAEFEKAEIEVRTSYPFNGNVRYIFHPVKENEDFTFAVHIPSYIKELRVKDAEGKQITDYEMKKGYLYYRKNWKEGDVVELQFPMQARVIHCNPRVRANVGKAALMKGPFVYCFEGTDNEDLFSCFLKSHAAKSAEEELPVFDGIPSLTVEGWKEELADELYTEKSPEGREVRLKAIPYYQWGNRGINEMKVWINEKWQDSDKI